jgi:hypothetical protein
MLKTIFKAKPKKRIELLKSADDELFRCICECSLNTIKSNVPLTDAQFKKLSPHKKLLRFLANKRIKLKSKRLKLVKQSGGFLLTLLAPILTTIIASMLK